jgi:hypothetical protein
MLGRLSKFFKPAENKNQSTDEELPTTIEDVKKELINLEKKLQLVTEFKNTFNHPNSLYLRDLVYKDNMEYKFNYINKNVENYKYDNTDGKYDSEVFQFLHYPANPDIDKRNYNRHKKLKEQLKKLEELQKLEESNVEEPNVEEPNKVEESNIEESNVEESKDLEQPSKGGKSKKRRSNKNKNKKKSKTRKRK